MTPAPRAVRHFGLAAIQDRAHRTAKSLAPAVPAAPVAPVAPLRAGPPVPRRTVVRLWVPATLLFLLLAPFALLLAPLLYLAPRPYAPRPMATVLGIGRLLLSLGGTAVHIEAPQALVSLRIF